MKFGAFFAPLGATLLLGSAAGSSLQVLDAPAGAVELVTCGNRAGTAFRMGIIYFTPSPFSARFA